MVSKRNDDGRFVLPTLILTVSSIDPPSLIINISLIEIALLFGVTISLAGQIKTITSIIGIAAALTMGVLSVRYDHKSLLMAGLLINLISSISCAFAPSLSLLIVSFSALGLVSSLVTPMVFAYIGEYFTQEKRSKTIGTLAALRTLIYLIMVQLIGLVVDRWSWRQAFLFLVVPLTSLGIVLTLKILPSIRVRNPKTGIMNYLEGYKSVINYRSAVACLLGNTLAAAAWMGIVMYSVSFLRERFLLSRSHASLIFSGIGVGVIIGNYVGGWLTVKYGRKNLAVLSALVVGILIIGYMNMPNILYTIAIIPLLSLFGGVILTAANSLTLEQVPSFRGTMMSLNSAASQLGIALGAGIGGLALFLYNWGFVGLSLGVIELTAACVYQLAAKDPRGSSASTQKEKKYRARGILKN